MPSMETFASFFGSPLVAIAGLLILSYVFAVMTARE